MADGYVRVASLAEVERAGMKVVPVGEYPVLVIWHGGQLRAVDNRCPHMGYPLAKGYLWDGMLRCDWHHWRFDLCSGGCLTEGGDDLPVFPVQIREGEVWVKPEPRPGLYAERGAKGFADLQQGLEQNSTFLIAKAVATLDAAGVPARQVLRAGAEHAVRFRAQGFGPGAVILTAMGRIYPLLQGEDRVLALVHGLAQVARDTAGRAPRRPQRPLPAAAAGDPEQQLRWLRLLAEEREAAGMERLVRTALARGEAADDVAGMLACAATDHFFLDTGHVLDFLNKACELVDLLGPESAADVLAAVVPPLSAAFRHEEDARWHEVLADLQALHADLPGLLAAPRRPLAPADADALLHTLLEGGPGQVMAAVRGAFAGGASLAELAQVLCRAGVWRVARFPLQNEEDWDDVLHVLSYNNAVDALVVRLAGRRPEFDAALGRAIAHGAVWVHLTRFLNVPKARLPGERSGEPPEAGDPGALLERLLYCAEFQRVEEAADLTWAYLRRGYPVPELKAALARACLKEDALFHMFQMLEAGLMQYDRLGRVGAQRHHPPCGWVPGPCAAVPAYPARTTGWGGSCGPGVHPDAALALVAVARYNTAQKLRRSVLLNTTTALKLRRGEAVATE